MPFAYDPASLARPALSRSIRRLERELGQIELISFVTNVTHESRDGLCRIAVPITDADAHATFYLSTTVDAPQCVQDIYRWVSER